MTDKQESTMVSSQVPLEFSDTRDKTDDMEEYLNEVKKNYKPTEQSSEQYSLQNLATQKQEFLQMREEYEDDDEIDQNESIFERLATEDELKQFDREAEQNCIKCKSKFNMISKRRNQCKFCAYLVCGEHSRKQREDPEKKGQKKFAKICDVCDEKYLRLQINKEFTQKKDKYDQIRVKLEEKQKQVIKDKMEKEKIYQNLQNKSKEEGNVYFQDQMRFGMKISRVKAEIKSLSGNYKEAQFKLNEIDDEIMELYKKIDDKKTLIRTKKDSERELSNKIMAIESDIKQTQFTIGEIERKITQNNLKNPKRQSAQKSKINIEEEKRKSEQLKSEIKLLKNDETQSTKNEDSDEKKLDDETSRQIEETKQENISNYYESMPNLNPDNVEKDCKIF